MLHKWHTKESNDNRNSLNVYNSYKNMSRFSATPQNKEHTSALRCVMLAPLSPLFVLCIWIVIFRSFFPPRIFSLCLHLM